MPRGRHGRRALKDRGPPWTSWATWLAASSSTPAPNEGHRQRLKTRFTSAGPEALPDYELLELVLFSAIPRRDTKPMAKRLLERFGSFAEVVNAPPERLKEVEGVGDAAIMQLKLMRAAALRFMPDGIMQRPCSAHGTPCSTIAAPPWASRRASSSASCSSTRRTG